MRYEAMSLTSEIGKLSSEKCYERVIGAKGLRD
jgi:hypothetical protein